MTVTAIPTPAQAAAIAYFFNGTRSGVRFNQASYAACRRNGWIEEVREFPFHRATDDGVRAIGQETPVHLHTGLGEGDKAVCGERITEQTRTAGSIDGTTCRTCQADYNAYRAKLTAELAKFAKREAPYDKEPGDQVDAAAEGDTRLPSGFNNDPVEDGVDEAALWTPDPLPVPNPAQVSHRRDLGEGTWAVAKPGGTGTQVTTARPAKPAPTSVSVDGREVVLSRAPLSALALLHADAAARRQHLNPNEGRRYFRAREEGDAALAEIKRRVDALHQAAMAAGPGSALWQALTIIDATGERDAEPGDLVEWPGSGEPRWSVEDVHERDGQRFARLTRPTVYGYTFTTAPLYRLQVVKRAAEPIGPGDHVIVTGREDDRPWEVTSSANPGSVCAVLVCREHGRESWSSAPWSQLRRPGQPAAAPEPATTTT